MAVVALALSACGSPADDAQVAAGGDLQQNAPITVANSAEGSGLDDRGVAPSFRVLTERERSALASHYWDPAEYATTTPPSAEVWDESRLLGFLPTGPGKRDGFLQVLYDDPLLGEDAAVTGFLWKKTGQPIAFEDAPLAPLRDEGIEDFARRVEAVLDAEWERSRGDVGAQRLVAR